MTEEEWLARTDLKAMLTFLQGKASDRKLHLFACACRRGNLYEMRSFAYRVVTEVMERYAEGLASIEALAATFDDGDFTPGEDRDAAYFVAEYPSENAFVEADCAAKGAHRFGTTPADVRSSQYGLLGDIIGSPFAPVAVDPRWLTSTVSNLAQAAYDERIMPSGELDPARLAVLSDCLEESGCDREEILNHLRSAGPHVRGCWVLDLLLGKS